MAFDVPSFNVVADLWFGTATPDGGDPDIEDQPCQLYIASRGIFDITPGVLLEWVPPIYLRMPLADISNWRNLQIVECLPSTGRYYKARWKEIMHLGFSNAYLITILEQCDGAGTAIIRDVVGGPPTPDHVALGVGEITVSVSGVGAAARTPFSPPHVAVGDSIIVVTLLASGAATRT